jgi:hypothetical protein
MIGATSKVSRRINEESSFYLLSAVMGFSLLKQWLMDLARGRLAEMEKRGILPKGKG